MGNIVFLKAFSSSKQGIVCRKRSGDSFVSLANEMPCYRNVEYDKPIYHRSWQEKYNGIRHQRKKIQMPPRMFFMLCPCKKIFLKMEAIHSLLPSIYIKIPTNK